jgi:diaminohydroxyphosphoribosylaminopyrimidine deaminase/5-amino-6-(5-phosphoribosylamino)uracil reductase
VRPNPLVGCVIVRDGRIVGSGYHRAAGERHAECLALAEAGALARDATLYVNLEPCAHHGRTAPCCEAIVRAGLRRVVAAIGDPNPLVDGRGFAALQAAGIDVLQGTLAAEARALNAPFLSTHERRRPWVTLKGAQSLDGRISAAAGSSTFVTGSAARRYAHRLRYRHDAVLVGAGTIRRDDPQLTVRLPGIDAGRRRVILAPLLDLDPNARALTGEAGTPPTRIYVSRECPEARIVRFSSVAEIVPVPSGPLGLDLEAMLSDLHRIEVQSVLVEGGGKTSGAFLRAGLVDELALFIAGRLFGSVDATPLIDGAAPAAPGDAWRAVSPVYIPIGGDLLVTARLKR